jgi:hypothetical protein
MERKDGCVRSEEHEAMNLVVERAGGWSAVPPFLEHIERAKAKPVCGADSGCSVPGALRLGLFPVLDLFRSPFRRQHLLGAEAAITSSKAQASGSRPLLPLYLFLRHRICPHLFITYKQQNMEDEVAALVSSFSYRSKSSL